MNSITFLFKSYRELLKERIRRHVYMRKLNFAVSTADQLHHTTKRKYYVVHDVSGDPTIVTASQVNDLKSRGRLPKEWTHLDLEKHSIYIPFQLKDSDKLIPNKKQKYNY